jgi:predicted transcriptional regulator
MSIRTISFRIDTEKLNALDELAASQRRDRSFLLNQAVENYIDLQAYQDSLVTQGIKAAAEGNYVGTAELKKRLGKLIAKRQPTTK